MRGTIVASAFARKPKPDAEPAKLGDVDVLPKAPVLPSGCTADSVGALAPSCPDCEAAPEVFDPPDAYAAKPPTVEDSPLLDCKAELNDAGEDAKAAKALPLAGAVVTGAGFPKPV